MKLFFFFLFFGSVQDAKLTKNKQELADRDHDLAEKEHELAQKDQLLNLKCEDIANLTDSLKGLISSLSIVILLILFVDNSVIALYLVFS